MPASCASSIARLDGADTAHTIGSRCASSDSSVAAKSSPGPAPARPTRVTLTRRMGGRESDMVSKHDFPRMGPQVCLTLQVLHIVDARVMPDQGKRHDQRDEFCPIVVDALDELAP